MTAPAGPLAATVAALRPLSWLALTTGQVPPAPGWTSAAALVTAEGVAAMTAVASAGLRAAYEDVDPLIAPSYVLEWYCGAIAAAAALPYAAARRVPEVAPTQLAVRLHPQGWPEAVVLTGPGFACLPDDPDADHPDATVVPDLGTLQALLRARVAGHLRPFLALAGRAARRGPHVQWGFASDALAVALWLAADDAGTAAGAAAAGALLDDAPAPWSRAGFRRLRLPDGRDACTRVRTSCCFAYRLPSAEACTTCPRTSDAERVARLAARPAP